MTFKIKCYFLYLPKQVKNILLFQATQTNFYCGYILPFRYAIITTIILNLSSHPFDQKNMLCFYCTPFALSFALKFYFLNVRVEF